MAVRIRQDFQCQKNNSEIISRRETQEANKGPLTGLTFKPQTYRTPLLSLLPTVPQNDSYSDEGYDEPSWTDAYRYARSIILESQRESVVNAKKSEILSSLKGIKARGEISYKFSKLKIGKKTKYEKTVTSPSNGSSPAVSYGIPEGSWIEGIPMSQSAYSSRFPTSNKKATRWGYTPQQRKTPEIEKRSRKHFEILKPWIDHSSQQNHDTILVQEAGLKCSLCRREPRQQYGPMNDFSVKSIYLPHHK